MNSGKAFAISVIALALCTSGPSLPAVASSEQVIYSLPVGSNPYGRPQEDSSGAIYGTAFDLDGSGAIFQLRERRGVWSLKAQYDFGGSEGSTNPYAGLTEDHSTTTFFGVTEYGGSANQGAIFTAVPSGKNFVESTLHSLSGYEGAHPTSLLTMDKTTGALYGTAVDGGTSNCGTAYELSQSGGNWAYTLLYTFPGGGDGCNPSSQLRLGQKAGTLIGATTSQGRFDDGTFFQLRESRGVWSSKTIHAFDGEDGSGPSDFDIANDGTIYGVTNGGGMYGCGIVFQMLPDGKRWDYSVIHQFQGGSDGRNPVGINFDQKLGVIYVTTQNGGTSDAGTVVKLTPVASTFEETVLHSFAGGADGAHPASRATIDAQTGYIHGTTVNGGANNGGTVYEIVP